jgi:hypothetical protein
MMEKANMTQAEEAQSKGAAIFKAMLERQQIISNHLENGGTIKELKEKGYQFGKVD